MSDEQDLGKMKLRDLFNRLSVGQTCSVVAAGAALLAGSAGLGGWVQSARDDDKIMDKNRAISELNSKIIELNTKV